MKYHIKNRLDLFDFHDAELTLVDCDNDKLVISAQHLNIHKDANENPHGCDMEIDSAKITFKQFKVISFEPWRTWNVDDEGNICFDEPQVIFSGEEASVHFMSALKKSFPVFELKTTNITSAKLIASGSDGFNSEIKFTEVTVELDEYRQKAWYELHKQYTADIALITPEGEKVQRIHIICHYEDTYYQGNLVKAPCVDIGMKYNDMQIWGRGEEDYTWEKALANLQKQLPEGIELKLCLTCRHGNLCPYGNEPGRVYCTKDLVINSKEDMCNIFDNHEKYNMWERNTDATESCNDYEPQSKDYYTYNDYLYHLEK